MVSYNRLASLRIYFTTILLTCCCTTGFIIAADSNASSTGNFDDQGHHVDVKFGNVFSMLQGPKGETGPTGPTGPKGDPGDSKGRPGEKGPTGPTGPQGQIGMKGDKGDKGDVGPRGQMGPKGDTGEDGRKGDTGPKGDKGDVGPRGQMGPKGDKGDVGPRGQMGPKGDQGDQGPQGEVGPQGDRGDIGDQGPQGDKGDQGEKGPQGDKGDKGDQGDQGPQGDKGDKGDKGDTGCKGPQGDKGDKGDQGEGIFAPTYLFTQDYEIGCQSFTKCLPYRPSFSSVSSQEGIEFAADEIHSYVPQEGIYDIQFFASPIYSSMSPSSVLVALEINGQIMQTQKVPVIVMQDIAFDTRMMSFTVKKTNIDINVRFVTPLSGEDEVNIAIYNLSDATEDEGVLCFAEQPSPCGEVSSSVCNKALSIVRIQ